MKKPPFVRLYVKDFSFDTQDMSDEELGKYMRLFIGSYKRGSISQKNSEQSLFLELEKSLESYTSVCKRNSKNRSKTKTSNNESSTKTQRPFNHEPITNNHEPIKNIIDESFSVFWDAFPRQRRGNKQKAIQAYKCALGRESKEAIQEGLNNYVNSKEVADGYAKGAAAWLNDDRWASNYSIKQVNGAKKNGKYEYGDAAREVLAELEQERADSAFSGTMLCDTRHIREN